MRRWPGFAREQVNPPDRGDDQPGGGRKFTSCRPASRTTSAGSGTLLIAWNRSHSRRVGETQNRQVMFAWTVVEQAVRDAARQADQVAGRGVGRLAVEHQVEAALEHIDELVLRRMDVRRHEGAGRQQRVPGEAALGHLQRRVGLAEDVPDDTIHAAALLGDAGGHRCGGMGTCCALLANIIASWLDHPAQPNEDRGR